MSGINSLSLNPATDKSVSLDLLQFFSPYYANPTDSQGKQIKAILDDVRSYVNRIDIFEDIFKAGLTGQIHFRDTQSITNLVAMRGFDQVRLQFSMTDKQTGNRRAFGQRDSQGRVSPFQFSVYNQTGRRPINQANENYTLGICSPELVSSISRKMSRSYHDTTDSIIQDIVQKPYGLNSRKVFVDLEKTKSPVKLVVPYLRPMEAINLLSMMGHSATDQTNYLFFETLEGYHYASFQLLLKNALKDTEIPTIYIDLAGKRELGNTKTRIKAEQLQVVSGFDILFATSHGYFSSVTIAPDVLSGHCGVEVSSIAPNVKDHGYSERQKLNNMDFYPSEFGLTMPASARMFLVPTTTFSAANTQLTSKDPTITDNFIAQTLDGRNRELLGLQTRCIRGRVPGAPELHAGKIINVQFPTTLNNKNSGSPVKDIASGRYIIVNAQHSIVSDGRGGFLYETTFEAVTDSIAT